MIKKSIYSLSFVFLFALSVVTPQNIFAEDVTITTSDGTTLVEGGNPRSLGELAGKAARTGMEIGLGIGQGFAGLGNEGSKGPGSVQIDQRGNSQKIVIKESGASRAPVVAKQTDSRTRIERFDNSDNDGRSGVVGAKERPHADSYEVDQNKGEIRPGYYSVNVVGTDGSVHSYSECDSVEIFKDGSVYQESSDDINFTGAVKFRTAGGDFKRLSGVINLSKE